MSLAESRSFQDGKHLYRVRSRAGGAERWAEWRPDAFEGQGGWKVEDRRDLLEMGHFTGNYEFICWQPA